MIEQLSTNKIYYRQLVEFLYHARKFTRHSVIDLRTAYAAWLANWQPDGSFWDGGALHASMPDIMHHLVVKDCLVEEIGTGGRFERLEQQREGRILRADLHVLSWQIFTVTEAGHQFIERELARGDLGRCLHDGRVQWWRLPIDQASAADVEQIPSDKLRRWRAAWQAMQGEVSKGKSCAEIAKWMRMTKERSVLAANNPKTVRAIIRAGQAGELD